MTTVTRRKAARVIVVVCLACALVDEPLPNQDLAAFLWIAASSVTGLAASLFYLTTTRRRS